MCVHLVIPCAGKATGVISTARITHATPAAAYAHSAHREYEAYLEDGNEENMETGCVDIATQLVHGVTGKDLNVSHSKKTKTTWLYSVSIGLLY